MRMTGLHFFHSLPSGKLLPDSVAVPSAPLTPAHTWQAVHAALTGKAVALLTVEELVGYAVYHYCVYQAFERRSEAELAQQLFGQALGQLSGTPDDQRTGQTLTQLCSVAWLHAQFTANGAASAQANKALALVDEQLLQEGMELLAQPQAGSHGNLVRILRYFSLRLPTPAALASLRQLLAQQAAHPVWKLPPTDTPPGQLALGLDDGLAAKLLVLINIHKSGLPDEAIQYHVRQGILHLLSVKREVDFLDQRYSVFPDYLQSVTGEAAFSAEMSWPHGDLGQALLLYEAHQLLQDTELANIAELVGLNTLLRVTIQSTQVTNSQFYQGAAGVAHLYHKLNLISQQEAYQQGYTFWLRQTQHYLHQELANGFYHNREGQVQQGLAGVGLVLLSALAPARLTWDNILL